MVTQANTLELILRSAHPMDRGQEFSKDENTLATLIGPIEPLTLEVRNTGASKVLVEVTQDSVNLLDIVLRRISDSCMLVMNGGEVMSFSFTFGGKALGDRGVMKANVFSCPDGPTESAFLEGGFIRYRGTRGESRTLIEEISVPYRVTDYVQVKPAGFR